MPRKGEYLLSAKQELEIVRYYKNGQSSDAIAAKFACCKKTVLKILHIHKARMRASGRPGLSHTDEIEIVQRYNMGENTNQLGKEYC
jgi:DNA-binding CsgD family transcriptional regulator